MSMQNFPKIPNIILRKSYANLKNMESMFKEKIIIFHSIWHICYLNLVNPLCTMNSIHLSQVMEIPRNSFSFSREAGTSREVPGK